MNMYKITVGQKNSTQHQPFQKDSFYHCVEDVKGDWFIDEIQMESLVKNKSWEKVTITEFVPPIIEID